jgi:hypothetical protein
LLAQAGSVSQLVRFEAHAQYVDSHSGLGGYLWAPLFYVGGHDVMSHATFGDIEIGGIYLPRFQLDGIGLVLHAGITLPTGNTEPYFGTMVTSAMFATLFTLSELYSSLNGGTTARFGISPTFRRGHVFARVDLGLDWNISASGSYGIATHYNAGIGVRTGAFTLTLESENATLTNPCSHPLDTTLCVSSAPSTETLTLDTLAISGRIEASTVSPYLAVMLPFSDSAQAVTWGATFGLDVKLP